jgi:hydroxybutyrate-dimer hydrolase
MTASSLCSTPAFLLGEIRHSVYDGISDDLLTGGLGLSGLQKAPPGFALATAPTAAELRRRAIYENYKALVDTSPGGGFGVFYGPVTEGDAKAAASDGKIAGHEFMSLAASASTHAPITVMVQIPAGFDWANPCVLTAPSSGSRGIYGGVPTVGEWGLKHGCAIAYTDKGSGIGLHDLERDAVHLMTGERVSANEAGALSSFTADLSPEDRQAFLQNHPHRLAFKHAHSQSLPDLHWGEHVRRAIEFALYLLMDPSVALPGKRPLTRTDIRVIASSISNGGAASLLAAEGDTQGLIDAVVVAEPAIQPQHNRTFAIVQGKRKPLFEHSLSQLDYFSLLNVYMDCALLDPWTASAAAPAGPVRALDDPSIVARAAALHARGLLKSTTPAAQGAEAQKIINDCGILEEQNPLEPLHSLSRVPLALAVTYANNYGRFGVTDTLAGYSFAAIDPKTARPAALDDAAGAQFFALGNGIAPTGQAMVINDEIAGGPASGSGMLDWVSTPDRNLDGAIRLHRLVTGLLMGGPPLSDEERQQHQRIRGGMDEVRAKGNLHGKPAIIVHGRADGVIAPNHSSRAYYGLNRVVEHDASNLHYYEIKHAHHFDAFNALPGYAERWLPLHHYFHQALAIMRNHLKSRTPLPPSQVVSPMPRGIGGDGKAPAIGPANLPPIAFDPHPDTRIVFGQGRLFIPE